MWKVRKGEKEKNEILSRKISMSFTVSSIWKFHEHDNQQAFYEQVMWIRFTAFDYHNNGGVERMLLICKCLSSAAFLLLLYTCV